MKVWDVETASPLKTLRGHDSWVRACAFSPDGKWVLSGGYDNHARLWNVEGYEEVRVMKGRVLEGHQDAIMAVSFSRDGHQIATASRDRTAKSWNADTGRELVSFREGHAFLASDSHTKGYSDSNDPQLACLYRHRHPCPPHACRMILGFHQ